MWHFGKKKILLKSGTPNKIQEKNGGNRSEKLEHLKKQSF